MGSVRHDPFLQFVLLDSFVELSLEEEDDEAAAVAAEKDKGPVFALRTPPFWTDFITSFLRSMTPDLDLHHPPTISTLKLRSSRSRQEYVALQVSPFAVVACTDKSMLVLYGGSYRGPGSSSRGCYLIYDAAISGASTLTSTVPPLPLLFDIRRFAPPAVVLRGQAPSSTYVLAELATKPERDIPDAELYLWRSDSPTPQWEVKEVRLPSEVGWEPGKHDFLADISFSFGTSLCWVDLLRGIVIYDDDKNPPFRFIPFPDGCPEYGTSAHPYRPDMRQFRTAACVAGTIKLVAMEGYLEGWEFGHMYRFVTWTLTPDLGQWKEDGVFHLKDIWASDKYAALGIRHYVPICPMLSPLDNGVVSVLVNDFELHDIKSEYSDGVRTEVEIKSQYALGLCMSNQTFSIDGGRPVRSVVGFTPQLFATDFCAYLQVPKDHQRDVKASEVVESRKRPKFC